MELVKNIFFNTDKLTPFIKVKISYTGKFFSDNSKKVFIHCGFGDDWENTIDLQMEKSELGYQAEIELINNSTFNLCFYNEKNEWDNNNSNNYIFPIEQTELSLATLDDEFSLHLNKKLSRFYLWKKKVKISVYKIINYLPKLITGNYKRKLKKEKP